MNDFDEVSPFDQADFVLPDDFNGQRSLPFRLTGSQAKTAFALRYNCEQMLAGNSPLEFRKFFDAEKGCERNAIVATKPENLNRAVFLTLTVGDEIPDASEKRGYRFQQIFDAKEASRRLNNLNRHVLPTIFERAILVTERHKNGAIHFHVVGILKSGADVRTGFDFAAFDQATKARNAGVVNQAAELRYKMAANPELLALWKMLREVLPGYGFGRSELTPIKKTGEAVACYVSKYIEKNICNRRDDDKRKKLVRYLGWNKQQLKPNEFSWAGPRACAWRCKTRECAALIGCETREDTAAALGPRWAFSISGLWRRFSDQVTNGIVWPEPAFPAREVVRSELLKLSGLHRWRSYLATTRIRPGRALYGRENEAENLALN